MECCEKKLPGSYPEQVTTNASKMAHAFRPSRAVLLRWHLGAHLPRPTTANRRAWEAVFTAVHVSRTQRSSDCRGRGCSHAVAKPRTVSPARFLEGTTPVPSGGSQS